MSDAFLIERARTVAARLAKARCWHSGAGALGSGTSTKWFDLNPADVEEAIIRLRELASAGLVHEHAAREAGDAQ
jgi:hypothetical protein